MLNNYDVSTIVCEAATYLVLPPERSDRVTCSLQIPNTVSSVENSSDVAVEHFVRVTAKDKSALKKQECQIPICIGPPCA